MPRRSVRAARVGSLRHLGRLAALADDLEAIRAMDDRLDRRVGMPVRHDEEDGIRTDRLVLLARRVSRCAQSSSAHSQTTINADAAAGVSSSSRR